MSQADPTPAGWEGGTGLPGLARNVSTRYLAFGVEAGLGVLLLPFNLARLGADTYGLWMVATSITVVLFVPRSRVRRRAGEVRRPVPGAAGCARD